MRIAFLFNPHSGRGNRALTATTAHHLLIAAGHSVVPVQAGPGLSPEVLTDALCTSDVLVVAGGDGSVHHAVPTAIAAKVPIFHFPLGTENLFAREFGMTRSAPALVRAIDRMSVRTIDTATLAGRAFVIMASVGFDACVVERVAAARVRGVTRLDYVRCAMQELIDFRVARLSITVDGKREISSREGLVVVANSPQYAARLNPVRVAKIDDGQIDVLFLPFSTRAGLAAWMLSILAGSHTTHPRAFSARAQTVEITSECGPSPLQLDGESTAGLTPSEMVKLQVVPMSLRVLIPV